MFHTPNIAADRQRQNAAARSRMQIELSERRMTRRFDALDTPSPNARPMTARASALALQQARGREAQGIADRREQNLARGAAMREGTLQLGRIARIEAGLEDEPSLADEGRAHLERARILKDNAFALNRMSRATNAPSEAMLARSAAQSSLDGAIGEETHGIAALEGRAGIAARTGLDNEKLDAFVAKSGIGPILDRHAAEAAPMNIEEPQTADGPAPEPTGRVASSSEPATQDPAAHRADLEKRLEPETFNLEVFRFRAARIKDLYGALDAPAETRATYNAMRKMHSEAHEAGPTSGQALRVNQRLVADLPEGSENREAMVAIRGIALERRKRQREAADAPRS